MGSHRIGWRVLALTFAASDLLAAQTRVERGPASWVGAPVEEYARLLQLTGVMPLSSRMIRPTDNAERWSPDDSASWRAPWLAHYGGAHDDAPARYAVTLLDVVSQSTYNSALPWGANDGAMWAGRGLSTQITAGAALRAGALRVQLAPTVTWSENRAFALEPLSGAPATASPYADPHHARNMDRPQRFGTGPVSRVDLGQSAVTVSARGARAGWSNENMWWGPGIDNSIVLTNNAPGFPHIFAGTARPANVWLGRLEVLYSVGFLEQSDYWRSAADTFPTDRWLNSLSFVFEPTGMSGLYLGAARTFDAYQRWSPIDAHELLQIFQPLEKKRLTSGVVDTLHNDRRDQMAALWLRWVLPDAGFEVYGEYGKNDHNADTRDLLVELDHGRAYTLGARKVVRAGHDGFVAMRGELANLTRSADVTFRGTPSWYAHHRIQQGYTQSGQLLGASAGPESFQQTAAIDWFTPRGRLGFTAQRRVELLDAMRTASSYSADQQPAVLEGGPRLTVFSDRLGGAIDVGYFFQYEFNREMRPHSDARNHHLELRGEFRIP